MAGVKRTFRISAPREELFDDSLQHAWSQA